MMSRRREENSASFCNSVFFFFLFYSLLCTGQDLPLTVKFADAGRKRFMRGKIQIENSFLSGPFHLIKLLSFFYPTNDPAVSSHLSDRKKKEVFLDEIQTLFVLEIDCNPQHNKPQQNIQVTRFETCRKFRRTGKFKKFVDSAFG